MPAAPTELTTHLVPQPRATKTQKTDKLGMGGHGPVGDVDGKEGTWGCEEQAVRQRKEAARSEGVPVLPL